MNEKTREDRLRRFARRYDLLLKKSRSRDALDTGLYALIDPHTGGAVNPSLAGRWACSWTLDDCEEYLINCMAAQLHEKVVAADIRRRGY